MHRQIYRINKFSIFNFQFSIRLSRLPLCGNNRIARATPTRRLYRIGSLRRDADDRHLRDFEQGNQRRLPQCHMGHKGQLPQYAHRLSAARRAHGLDWRPHDRQLWRELHLRQPPSLCQVAAGSQRQPVRKRITPRRCPRLLAQLHRQHDLAGCLHYGGRHDLEAFWRLPSRRTAL